MLVLTVLQPYASALIAGIKPVENRDRRPADKHIGKLVVIHAGRKRIFLEDERIMAEVRALWPNMPPIEELPIGKGIGVMRLTACVAPETRPTCPWTCGPKCWVFTDPVVVTPFLMVGMPGLFPVPDAQLPEEVRRLNR